MTNIKFDDIETIISNSYKNFHAKGLDYICLARSPKRTTKVYFLDGDVTKVPEVINPHNHRYSFSTRVLAGAMVDHVYYTTFSRGSENHFQRFDYMTPLNGGDGFTYVGDEYLYRQRSETVYRNQAIHRPGDVVHTIQMLRDQTVLLLDQYADEIPIDVPTQCWVRKGYPKPELSGLYDRFTEDEVLARLRTVQAL